MRPFESLILFVVVDNIGDMFLLVEAALVDRVFGEVRLYYVKFAEMAAAGAIVA